MKYDILHRRTGAVLFTADIACDEMASWRIKTGLAVQWALNNGANLALTGIIHVGTRSDGREFYAFVKGGKIWIKSDDWINYERVYDTITKVAKRFRGEFGGSQIDDESLQLLKNARALVKIRGLK